MKSRNSSTFSCAEVIVAGRLHSRGEVAAARAARVDVEVRVHHPATHWLVEGMPTGVSNVYCSGLLALAAGSAYIHSWLGGVHAVAGVKGAAPQVFTPSKSWRTC